MAEISTWLRGLHVIFSLYLHHKYVFFFNFRVTFETEVAIILYYLFPTYSDISKAVLPIEYAFILAIRQSVIAIFLIVLSLSKY